MGTECKVRIDGAGNASWLQFQLTEKGIECGESVLLKGTAQVVFHVLYPAQFADDDLRHFIAGFEPIFPPRRQDGYNPRNERDRRFTGPPALSGHQCCPG
jgi:hypothetical protein